MMREYAMKGYIEKDLEVEKNGCRPVLTISNLRVEKGSIEQELLVEEEHVTRS